MKIWQIPRRYLFAEPDVNGVMQPTRFMRVVNLFGNVFGGFMWFNWILFRLGIEVYCPRCQGCGYVDCCGIKCDRGFFCVELYPDTECVSSHGVITCIPGEVRDVGE